MERNPFRHATGVTPPPQGEASCGHHLFTGSRNFISSLFPIPYYLFPALPLPACNKNSTAQKFPPHLRTIPHNATSRHQKIPPHALPSQPRSDPGLFRAEPGPIWVRFGLFWVRTRLFRVDSGLPGPESRCFGPRFPLPRAPLRPGECAKTSPPSPRI